MSYMIFSRRTINERQEKSARALEKLGKNVLVFSGNPITKPGGLDQTYTFLPHPRHYWLSGFRRSGCVMAYAPGEGWTCFVRPIDEDEIIWEGVSEEPEGRPISELPQWLSRHSGHIHDGTVIAGSEMPGYDYAYSPEAAEILDSCRRPKDSEEIALIRRAVDCAAPAFAKIRDILSDRDRLRPKYRKRYMTERGIQTELEAEFIRRGAHGTSFDTIVAADRHTSVLHFPPGDSEANDVVMIDAGTQVYEYSCDITRTIPVDGIYSSQYRQIFDLVVAAQKAAISMASPGVEWNRVHIAAATVIAKGLAEMGILRCSPYQAVDNGAVGLFMPHGIGHMLGLRVRDVGGKLKGRENNRYAGTSIRVDMPLEEGFVMTAEPGVYFIEPLLKSEKTKEKYGSFLNWNELEKWLNIGGCRQEDDILITKSGCEVLTSDIPKETVSDCDRGCIR